VILLKEDYIILFFHGPFDREKPLTFRSQKADRLSWRLLFINAVETQGQNLSLGTLRVGCALGDRREQK